MCKIINAYPKGSNVDGHFSIYLRIVESETFPSGWSQNSKFSFTVIDQIDNKSSLTKDREHEFNAEFEGSGFCSFISL